MKKLIKIFLILITVSVFVISCAKGNESILPTAPTQQTAVEQSEPAPAPVVASNPAPATVTNEPAAQVNASTKKTGLERAYEVSGNERVGELLQNGNPGKGKK